MLLDNFVKTKKIHPPEWLISNCHFLANAGSYAYGTHNEFSDIDIFGFCTPKLEMVLPWKFGYLPGFGTKPPNFERWSEQHIIGDDGKEYDFCVLGIIHYFHLLYKNNPDQIDVLFVPRECVRHSTSTGEMVRDNRHKFLSKRAFYTFRGYAMSQKNKAMKEVPIPGSKRDLIRKKYGYDTVFTSHLYRLCLECEQILTTGDIDLQRDKELLKFVKNGGIKFEEAERWFSEKEKYLEKLLGQTKIQEHPDETEIKQLLFGCLENHYGSLDKAICFPTMAEERLRQIHKLSEGF